jgi:hypothetical protein
MLCLFSFVFDFITSVFALFRLQNNGLVPPWTCSPEVNLYILTEILEAFLGNLLNNVSHSQETLVLLVVNSVSNQDHFSGLHVQGGTSPLF